MQDPKMPPEHYQSLMQLEDNYWWHQSRYHAVWEAFGRHGKRTPDITIADIGCGTGGFLRFLRARGFENLTGYDFSEAAREALRRTGLGALQIDLEEPFVLSGAPVDVIVALDVIEHVEHEETFVCSAAANLSPGGLFLVTVPGHQFLFSAWDRQLNHFRRYSRERLRRSLETGGLTVLESSHLFAFVMPMALLRRWSKRYERPGTCEFPPVPVALNALLKRLAQVERAWLRVGSLPIGTSLLAVARKSD